MDERLSLKAVDDYSDDYASKVTASFFASKDRITGSEILSLSPIHQINLFVLRELLLAWRHEGQKLRSPFFDYNAPEVVDALRNFQNTLSKNISITRENFQPLLKKAVSQTIYLIIDPYDFFSDTLDRHGSTHVRTEDLRNDIKYLKINRPPLEKLVNRLEEKKLDLISGKEAFGLLDQILEEVNFTPEDVDAYLPKFSQILPIKLENLYERKPAPPPPPSAPVRKEEPIVVTKKPLEAAVAHAVKEQKAIVADGFQKIGRIKDGLTINQKFMFTKILFNGDFEIFSGAIEKLDRFDNLKQALSYIDQNYPEWDKESEEYEEFIELVQKRFA
jgi:hypothetical protein